jgi:site-specific DNA recombinase
MHVAIYARISTRRQAQAQTIDHQLERLEAHVLAQGWELDAHHIFRDQDYSGATLRRPGLEGLRDLLAAGLVERILITAPDRLARNYVHQVLLIEELQRFGAVVEFLDSAMSPDPHDQLLLQIRGAVAEYERTLTRGTDAPRTPTETAGRSLVALDTGPLRVSGASGLSP